MALKNITIPISDFATLVGLDAYNNFPRNICKLWRKSDPADFKIFESKLKSEGCQIATADEMNDIWDIDEILGTNILEQVKAINNNTDKSSSEMVLQQNAISKYINNNDKLETKQKDELTKKVCSITNKMNGVINEDCILEEFCRLSEKTIKKTQDWVEIPIKKQTELKYNWVIVGKYDGITTDNELVEAKMRQKALFKKVRDYENVQVQLYLHALQFEQGYLVESYSNKKGDRQIYVNEVKYDEDYVINTLLERIVKFTEFFEMYINKDAKNDTIKESLLKGDSNRKIYKMYEEEYLGIEKDTISF